MADSINSNYAGEAARGYFEASVMQANSLQHIRVEEGIKFKQNIRVIGTSGLVQDGSCDFSDAGDLNLSERVLAPKELKVNKVLCKSDFLPTFEAQAMSAGDDTPNELIDYVFASIAKKIAKATEQSIWNGDSANGGEFDGFLKLMNADAAVQDVVILALTSFNVADEMTKVLDVVMADADLRDAEGLKLFISPDAAYKYAQYLALNHGAAGIAPNGAIAVGSFMGHDVVIAAGLPADKIVATYSDNLVFGTDLMSDAQDVALLDMAQLDGSKNMRFIANYKAGVQYAVGADIVLGQTA